MKRWIALTLTLWESSQAAALATRNPYSLFILCQSLQLLQDEHPRLSAFVRTHRFIGGPYEVPSKLADAADLDTLLQQRVAAFQGRDDWMGTFLDNHDEIRTKTRLHVLGVTTETEREQRMDLGTVLLMTVRGIPTIYYGDEPNLFC